MASTSDAATRPGPKILTLKIPLVPVNEFDCSHDELVRRCQTLSHTNAELRREYDALVLERSASLSSLRQQLAAMVQDDIEESSASSTAFEASQSVQEEVHNLKSVVDFMQQEDALTKAALRESEARLNGSLREVKELKLRLSASQDSIFVYEQSLSEIQAKFLKESESCAFLRLSLKESEEKRKHSDIRAADLALQLRRCIAENEEKISSLQQSKSALEAENQQKLANLEHFRVFSSADNTALIATREEFRLLAEKHGALVEKNGALESALQVQREENGLLLEKLQALSTSFHDYQVKSLQQHREMSELTEDMAQSNQKQAAVHIQEQAQARIVADRCHELEGQNGALVARNNELTNQKRELEAKTSSIDMMLQISLDEYQRSTSEMQLEFQNHLRRSRLFASEYVSNCVDSVCFAVTGLFFWKWKFVTSNSSKAQLTNDASQAHQNATFLERNSIARHITTGPGIASSKQASPAKHVHTSTLPALDLQDLTTSPRLHHAKRSHGSTIILTPRRVASAGVVPDSRTLSAKGSVTGSDAIHAIQLLDEVCSELSSVAFDLRSHASEIKLLVTSAATFLNEAPSRSDTLTDAHSLIYETCSVYLKSVSDCESRLHDVSAPLRICIQNLSDILGSLYDAVRPVDDSPLNTLSSQLSDAGLAIELAVRNTESSSIELRTLLDLSLSKTEHLDSSRSKQQSPLHRLRVISLRISAERSSMNLVLGSILSCRNRIATCADVVAACHFKLHASVEARKGVLLSD
jgi:hypothetical protein